ncbi:hypothetical protein [Pseudovibrio sp. Tun.PSC04-5.I4]|uniref:hypothetical protein n=1 Tax=Pseudovibrio sp. Tun.PSC04-5.I4 TaxID=1798213 RepID=UPI000889B2C4|nr:hypothetical protein [Pseudovibrio sp. Tun.PSC04-5.I4]SDQ98007.1 hypothetical protein SAMN04515695_2157 [Pseudovibrio sp. Tun.PSC04-5.I4]
MPETKLKQPAPPLTRKEDSWAKSVFQEFGLTYPDFAAAVDGLYVAIREKEEQEIAAAAALEDEQDRKLVEHAATVAAVQTMAMDNFQQISELFWEIEELKTNPPIGGAPLDDSRMAFLQDQIAGYRIRNANLFKNQASFKDFVKEDEAFRSIHETVDLLLQKAELNCDAHSYDACEGSLAETRSKLDTMQSLLQDVIQNSGGSIIDETEKNFSKQIISVKECITDLTGIGYTGLATRLSTPLATAQSLNATSDDPAWQDLFKNTEEAKASMVTLKNMTAYIEKLCASMQTAGPSEVADQILEELGHYRTDPSRNLATVVSLIFTLKTSAIRKEKWSKNKEWAKKDLDIRTRNYKEQLEKLVMFGDGDTVVTKKSTTESYARAGDIDGLTKDVMVEIPKRPKDKKAKAVPRKTLDSLLESFDFLDELRSSGVSGIETIAVEEFLKAEDILDGLQRNPGGYEDLQKRTQKILDKINKSKGSKEGLYYIEAKMRLVEDVKNLRDQSSGISIDKAIRQCEELETEQFEPLMSNIKMAIEFRKIIDLKIQHIEKRFKDIPILLAKLGAARPELAQKFKAILQPKNEKIYHGELELYLKQARIVANNSSTVDDLKESLTQMNRIKFQAEKYIMELKGRLDWQSEQVDSPHNVSEDSYFQKIEEDYKQGIQLAKDRKISKDKFTEKAGPIKENLEILTSKAASWKNIKGKIKGIDRIDESVFDPTKFKDLLTEIKLLEQESAKNSSHEENMGQLNELKGMYDAMHGELTGFREDIAKGVKKAADNCIARMELTKSIADNYFIDILLGNQEAGEQYVDTAALKKFISCVTQPLVAGDLKKHVQIIADTRQTLIIRKKAREDALRIVRPLLAQLDSAKAIKLYRRHPFTNIENDFNTLRPALIQLEVKLLTLAS